MSDVKKILLIRKEPLEYPKVRTYCPPHWLAQFDYICELYRFIVGIFLCLTQRVDVVMGIYLLWHGILAAWVGKICRRPVIQNLIGDEHLLMQRHRWMTRTILNADVVITRGAVTKQQLIVRGMSADRIFPIPNLFDFSKIPKLKVAEKTSDLIYIGALSQIKRVDLLLKAIHQVKTHYHVSVTATIVGDGELREQLQLLTESLGLTNQVTFVGHRRDVYDFLVRSRIFIMTSDHEGFPMAMIEAMACGLPCIMPDVSNIPDLAQHNHNALLAPVGDVNIFAQHIHALTTDKLLYQRLAAHARQIRQEKAWEYSIEFIVQQWQALFKKLAW
jgi:L-malate glycosyltransferase